MPRWNEPTDAPATLDHEDPDPFDDASEPEAEVAPPAVPQFDIPFEADEADVLDQHRDGYGFVTDRLIDGDPPSA